MSCCFVSFQSRIVLASDSLVVALLNSVTFTTSIKFNSSSGKIDVLSIVRDCVLSSSSEASGVSCIYIRHLLSQFSFPVAQE